MVLPRCSASDDVDQPRDRSVRISPRRDELGLLQQAIAGFVERVEVAPMVATRSGIAGGTVMPDPGWPAASNRYSIVNSAGGSAFTLTRHG